MSLNEMTPSTNLVLGSITTSRRTPDDNTWRVRFKSVCQIHVKEIVLVSCITEIQTCSCYQHTCITKISTWYRQFFQDLKQCTPLRTSMALSSAIHLVLHI
jgi:hypothetical protein